MKPVRTGIKKLRTSHMPEGGRESYDILIFVLDGAVGGSSCHVH